MSSVEFGLRPRGRIDRSASPSSSFMCFMVYASTDRFKRRRLPSSSTSFLSSSSFWFSSRIEFELSRPESFTSGLTLFVFYRRSKAFRLCFCFLFSFPLSFIYRPGQLWFHRPCRKTCSLFVSSPRWCGRLRGRVPSHVCISVNKTPRKNNAPPIYALRSAN